MLNENIKSAMYLRNFVPDPGRSAENRYWN